MPTHTHCSHDHDHDHGYDHDHDSCDHNHDDHDHGSQCDHDHSYDMDPLQSMLVANTEWVEGVLRFQPHFFEDSAKGQTPHTLWIGCADSRVPESVITLARPGDIFVHRNIANQVSLSDPNGLSVLDYAVNHLGVENVIVVGHAGCGGAQACLSAAQRHATDTKAPILTIPTEPADSPLNLWLAPLTRLALTAGLDVVHKADALPFLVDENVKAQIYNLSLTETIKNAWSTGTPKKQSVWIHGWVYDLKTGYLKDLHVSQGPPSERGYDLLEEK